jgi:hypothetical protein
MCGNLTRWGIRGRLVKTLAGWIAMASPALDGVASFREKFSNFVMDFGELFVMISFARFRVANSRMKDFVGFDDLDSDARWRG